MKRPTPMRRRSDAGQATAFVVIVIVGLILAAGLVFDGGRILAARRAANDVARTAARVGAEQVDPRDRNGDRIDTARAQGAARQFFTQRGYSGDVVIEGDTVTVRVHRDLSVAIVPIGTRHINGMATAAPIREGAP